MRAFSAEREVGPADADDGKKEGEVKRIVSLKKHSRDNGILIGKDWRY